MSTETNKAIVRRWDEEVVNTPGDMVVVRGTYHLTHTGEAFFGIAPTGKHVTTTGMHLFPVADKKIVEHWCNNDDLGVMRQLGVVS